MIDVSDFVALDEIDPIYYENTYWLVPDGDGAKKSYQLLVAAMEDAHQVGIGTVVLREKQHLAAVRPLDGALAMSTMRFTDEVVARSEIEGLPRRSTADPKALRMAKQLIEGLSTEWNPKQYHDTYTEALRKRIAAKDSGKEVVDAAEEPTGRVLDLMAALEASVEAGKKRNAARKPARKATRKAG